MDLTFLFRCVWEGSGSGGRLGGRSERFNARLSGGPAIVKLGKLTPLIEKRSEIR